MSTEMEWTEVKTDSMVDETKVVFDTIGDEFIGLYLGMRTQEDEEGKPYSQIRWSVGEGDATEYYFTNATYGLRQAYKAIRPNTMTRTRYTEDLDTGRPTPMKIFKVDVARPRRAGRASSENS